MALQRREKSSPEIPTGSMADIVFLLAGIFLGDNHDEPG